MSESSNTSQAWLGSIRSLHERLTNKDQHHTSLTLDPLHPGIGGQLGGFFKIQSKLLHDMPAAEPILVTLTCYLQSNSANAGQTGRKIKWQQTMPASYSGTPTEVKGAFLFNIPDSCIPTGKRSLRTEYTWRISLRTEHARTTYAGGVIASWPIIVADAPQISKLPQSVVMDLKQSETSTLDVEYRNEKTERAGALIVGAIFSSVGAVLLLNSEYAGAIFLVLACIIHEGFASRIRLAKQIV